MKKMKRAVGAKRKPLGNGMARSGKMKGAKLTRKATPRRSPRSTY